MMRDVGAPKLPPTKWISLTSALTWLAFDRAIEIEELGQYANKLNPVETSKLVQALAEEWRRLADYASDGSISVRARPENGQFEVALGTEELRTHQHLGWVGVDRHILVLDRFPVTFEGAFKARASQQCGGLLDAVTVRSQIITYKQVVGRAKQRKYALAKLNDAQALASKFASRLPPQTGLKDKVVRKLVDKFGIPKIRAAEIWRNATPHWPKRGRPKSA